MRGLPVFAAVALVALGACSGPQPPAGPRALVAEAVVGDAGAAPAIAAILPPEPDRSPATKDDQQVARTLVKVSALRGVPATKAVPGVKLDRDQLVARVRDKALREYPPEALRREGLLLQLFGFAPPTFDYLSEMMKLLDAQLEGFYEPKNGTMYLASDLKGAQAQATLAHELVHALQDQRWDLRKRSDYKPGRGDESMALACLAEGDATSLMLDFGMKPARSALDIPPDAIRELMKGGINTGDIQSVPHILRSTLVAPYMEGIAFVHELRHRGGWSAVDGAWNRLPTTTEQVLHVDKWEMQEGPLTVAAPSGRALGEGWTNEDQDTFGELGMALTLAEWMSDDDARLAASGWGGDRTSAFTKGDQLAFAVHLRFDAASLPRVDAYAERAMGKIIPALTTSLGKPTASTPTTLCFERKELGPLLFARKEREVVMLAGPARVASGKWASTATCAQAKRWADEVIVQP